MAGVDRRGGSRVGRAQEIGLFRFALIRQAADPGVSHRDRGVMVRALADTDHVGPFGTPVRVSRVTLDRWIRAWRTGGFEALVPSPRGAVPRTPAEVLELAAALKRENPARTAAHIAQILSTHGGPCPSARTLQRHFARLELTTRPHGMAPKAFGRFQAEARNDRWTGDALHGPMVAGRKTYLFAFIDDYSRALVAYRWSYSEDTLRLESALRAGLAARGIPAVVYLDNGAAMVSGQLRRALAVAGIRLVHSRPGQPAGRGKIERFFRTVRDQFLVELVTPDALAAINDLTELNELFTAWVETVYHHRVHSETGEKPLPRFLAAGPPTLPAPDLLAEAFKWSHERTVTKTATISVHTNTYQVDASLIGRKIEVVFDPMDMTRMEVRYQGRPMGHAVPHTIGRHVHPDAGPDTAPTPPPAPTGIDYLHLIAEHHQHTLATQINYAHLTPPTPPATADAATTATDPDADADHVAGQLALTDLTDLSLRGGDPA